MPQLQPFWDADYSVTDPGPYVGPVYSSNPWDTAYVRGMQIPGIVTLNVVRERAIYAIAAPGIVPSNIKIGYNQIRFGMTVKLWTPQQWESFQPIIWALQPIFAKAQKLTEAQKKSRKAADSAFDVQYPTLAALSVHSCICEKLGPLSPEGQVRTFTMAFLEYRTGNTPVATIDTSIVDAPFNEQQLAASQVRAANGKVTPYTQTHGPQQKPSTSGVTLNLTTP